MGNQMNPLKLSQFDYSKVIPIHVWRITSITSSSATPVPSNISSTIFTSANNLIAVTAYPLLWSWMVRFSIGAPTIFAASWTVVLLENQSTCSKFTATFGTGLLTHIERCDVSSRKTPMIFPENSDGVPLRMMGFGWVASKWPPQSPLEHQSHSHGYSNRPLRIIQIRLFDTQNFFQTLASNNPIHHRCFLH